MPQVAQDGGSVKPHPAHVGKARKGDTSQGIDLVAEKSFRTGRFKNLRREGCSVAFLRDAVEDGAEEEVVAEGKVLLQFGYGMARAGEGERLLTLVKAGRAHLLVPGGGLGIATVEVDAAQTVGAG